MTTPHPINVMQQSGFSPRTVDNSPQLGRVYEGDENALNERVGSIEPLLTCWTPGRLPPQMRASLEIVDLVQEAFTRAIKKINVFESPGPGAFLAYLPQVFNLIS